MASGLFRYNGKRIKKKNLIKNHFQGYSLVSNKNQVERRGGCPSQNPDCTGC